MSVCVCVCATYQVVAVAVLGLLPALVVTGQLVAQHLARKTRKGWQKPWGWGGDTVPG